eukprot:CAMPEP_0181384916 /NCGR_PEP_ID=MMETSP1106-20121128/22248_1 /TAXON_ID=81844 /ORGANISM="Mantoniella antarctica, Strain SL-175" /LENGTH=91 /DNA_ID=CAMNT_0023504875 /DNA_START=357 /DNA_END=628 /DNA_ORIENTATION=+
MRGPFPPPPPPPATCGACSTEVITSTTTDGSPDFLSASATPRMSPLVQNMLVTRSDVRRAVRMPDTTLPSAPPNRANTAASSGASVAAAAA